MSFQFHPGTYECITLKHQDLIAEAEQARLLSAQGDDWRATERARAIVGRWLIALGERIARPVHATGRV